LIKAVIFDLDDTIVHSWAAAPEQRGQPCPGVLETLEQLQQRNIPIAICTNQAGPLWRWITGNEKYPDVDQVKHSIIKVTQVLNIPNALWFISTYDPRAQERDRDAGLIAEIIAKQLRDELNNTQDNGIPGWRKPEPGMLIEAARSRDLSPQECLYCRDMNGSQPDKFGKPMDSDREAARRAGMHFVSASNLALIPDVIELFNLGESGEERKRFDQIAEKCGQAGIGLERGESGQTIIIEELHKQ
jgi:histidinol phosphatase-like enzyme